MPARLSDSEAKEFLKLYESGLTVTEIAKRMKRDRHAVSRALKRLGVRIQDHPPMVQTIRVPEDKGIIGYLAGLIDGEGNIRMIRRIRCYIVQITNQNKELLDWLLANIGGWYSVIKPNPKNRQKRECYQWRVSRIKDCEALLKAVLPYLIVKREKALQALALLSQTRWRV